ncbi:hypothetical protein [Streptomyces sp. Agncl-13]|uniref:hypothetical protein n=1 Tax=Streptomyces sp. Agncl-13 TaxID=3400628 RepID=UPI003A879CF5
MTLYDTSGPYTDPLVDTRRRHRRGRRGSGAVRRRILAVREHHAGAAHVWFLRRDP